MLKKLMLSMAAVFAVTAVSAAEFKLVNWISSDKEGVVSEENGNNFVYTIVADHQTPGSKGNAPCGWVRVRTLSNNKAGVDMTKFNQFEFDLTISSEVDDPGRKIPLSVSVACHNEKKMEIYLSRELKIGKSYSFCLPAKALTRLDAESLKKVVSIQFVVREQFLPEKKAVKFQFSNLRLTSGDNTSIKVESK